MELPGPGRTRTCRIFSAFRMCHLRQMDLCRVNRRHGIGRNATGMVPSIGSITQVKPLVPGLGAPSSPRIASSGKAAVIC